MGWVNSRRNLGGLIFVWLRDRSGVIQLVFDEAEKKSYFADAQSLRSKYVIAVKGQIAARAPENYNDDLATGRIGSEGRGAKKFCLKRKRRPLKLRRTQK